MSELSDAVEAVEARLDAIQTECNANTVALQQIQLPTPPDLTDLTARVAALEARPADTFDPTELVARLDAIEAFIRAGHPGPAYLVDEAGQYLTDDAGNRLTV